MNIAWVLSDQVFLDTTLDIQALKNLGSIWGSWQTWRAYQTDNVICYNFKKSQELIQRNFQNLCNFYISNSSYVALNRPAGVKLFEGQFDHDVDHHEDIVALHLASSQNDIVLLLGFDLSEQEKLQDKLQEHRANNYRNLVDHAIKNNQQVQWVVVDHANTLRKSLQNLSNLTQDTLENILKSGL